MGGIQGRGGREEVREESGDGREEKGRKREGGVRGGRASEE